MCLIGPHKCKGLPGRIPCLKICQFKGLNKAVQHTTLFGITRLSLYGVPIGGVGADYGKEREPYKTGEDEERGLE